MSPPGKDRRPGLASGASTEQTGGGKSLDVKLPPIHEPSGWLRGVSARRVRDARRAGLNPDSHGPIIVLPIGSSCARGSREDRTCDRCRAYVPEGAILWLFGWQAAQALILTGALCTTCHTREGWTT